MGDQGRKTEIARVLVQVRLLRLVDAAGVAALDHRNAPPPLWRHRVVARRRPGVRISSGVSRPSRRNPWPQVSLRCADFFAPQFLGCARFAGEVIVKKRGAGADRFSLSWSGLDRPLPHCCHAGAVGCDALTSATAIAESGRACGAQRPPHPRASKPAWQAERFSTIGRSAVLSCSVCSSTRPTTPMSLTPSCRLSPTGRRSTLHSASSSMPRHGKPAAGAARWKPAASFASCQCQAASPSRCSHGRCTE